MTSGFITRQVQKKALKGNFTLYRVFLDLDKAEEISLT